MTGPCYCGADDCPDCRPWNFTRDEWGQRRFIDPIPAASEETEDESEKERASNGR